MDGISRSRGWDKEIPNGVLPMKQLVLSDKWARNGYLTCVSMWDRFIQQPASIGITRSCMHWYVIKIYLTWIKTTEMSIKTHI